MKKLLLPALAAIMLTCPAAAQEAEPQGAPSPNQIVDAAPASEWMKIPAEDLVVMTLAPDVRGDAVGNAQGDAREIIIQLMPAPFSQGWVKNIRTLAREGWYDGITVNRVQDNYVVQWGDPNADSTLPAAQAKPLPGGLRIMKPGSYTATMWAVGEEDDKLKRPTRADGSSFDFERIAKISIEATKTANASEGWHERDGYAEWVEFWNGWPLAYSETVYWVSEDYDRRDDPPAPAETSKWFRQEENEKYWPVHCYAMVGVGRGYSPDTGSGAELYTVIGHAPRHLDRNIALVGRIVEGMEHLTSLPRGSGPLGFYTDKESDKRTPIQSVRVASDLPVDQQPAFEFLSTNGESFARYLVARANRRDPFFITPAGGADICNIPVPVRRIAGD